MIIKLVTKAALLALILSVPLYAQSTAEDYGFTVDTQVEMAEEGVLNVTQSIQVRNRTSSGLEELEVAMLSDSVSDTEVKYANGDDISFSTLDKHRTLAGHRFDYKSLLLDLPRKIDGAGRTWTVEVSYKVPDGWHLLGAGGTVILPNLDAGTGGSWRLVLTSPPNFPDINYGPKVRDYKRPDGRQRAVFSNAEYAEPVVAASFINDVTSEVSQSRHLRNRSLWPSTKTLIIPPDLHGQRVYVDDISPRPDKISVDPDGNVVAEYRLWPLQSINATYRATVAARQLRYDFRKAKPTAETPESLSRLTAGNTIWTTQGEAGKKAATLIDSENTAWENTVAILDFVKKEIETEDSQERRPADEVLSAQAGNKLEKADLLIAMLRSQGIPSRLLIGHTYPAAGYDNDSQLTPWAEAYIAGSGWATLDEGWSGLFKSRGYNPADRVALAVFGDENINGTTPAELVGSAGDFSATIIDSDLPPPEPAFNLSKVRYLIVPYLGIDRVAVTSGSGYVVDDVSVNDNSVGSIGPRQRLIFQHWFAGNAPPGDAAVKVGEETVAETVTEVQRWPILVVASLVAALAMLQFLRWFKTRKYMKRRLDG